MSREFRTASVVELARDLERARRAKENRAQGPASDTSAETHDVCSVGGQRANHVSDTHST